MLLHRIAISVASCLIAVVAAGQESECATSYRADGKASQATVMTSLDPQAVVTRLPRLLIAAGLTMRWTEPEKGTLKAEGLEVQAEKAGSVTRVTFYSSVGADKDVLCRYAGLVGSPASAMAPPVPQDPALIAQMKDDLLKKQTITQPDTGIGPSSAAFHSATDFTDFRITTAKETADQRVYSVSVLLPHEACILASETVDDAVGGFGGKGSPVRTKPVRVDVSLIYYLKDAGQWRLADATISHIETTK